MLIAIGNGEGETSKTHSATKDNSAATTKEESVGVVEGIEATAKGTLQASRFVFFLFSKFSPLTKSPLPPSPPFPRFPISGHVFPEDDDEFMNSLRDSIDAESDDNSHQPQAAMNVECSLEVQSDANYPRDDDLTFNYNGWFTAASESLELLLEIRFVAQASQLVISFVSFLPL
jgi:hypothetical protein